MGALQIAWHVIREYGFSVFVSVAALAVLGWLFKTSVRNPVEIMSQVMNDLDMARQALRQELEARDATIAARDLLIAELKAEVLNLTGEVDKLRAKIREFEEEMDEYERTRR